MSQKPTDISLDVLLRTLERRYAYHAARLFRAHKIPEPPRLPEPALPEPMARVDVPRRQPDPIYLRVTEAFHNSERKQAAAGADTVSV
jgi:hypothetical protein